MIPFQFLSALKCLQLVVFLFSSENIIIVVFRRVVSNTCYSIAVRWAPSWGYYIHFYMRYWFVIFLPWSLLSIKIMDKKTSWIKRVYPSLSNIDLDFLKITLIKFFFYVSLFHHSFHQSLFRFYYMLPWVKHWKKDE